jgi:hypothetical protein
LFVVPILAAVLGVVLLDEPLARARHAGLRSSAPRCGLAAWTS